MTLYREPKGAVNNKARAVWPARASMCVVPQRFPKRTLWTALPVPTPFDHLKN